MYLVRTAPAAVSGYVHVAVAVNVHVHAYDQGKRRLPPSRRQSKDRSPLALICEMRFS